MPRALTVLQLLPALESGGVERSTIEIAQALIDGGHRALVMSAGGRLLASLLATGAQHIDRDIGRKSLVTVRHVRPLRELLRRERVDIVHARSRLPAWVGWRALRGIGDDTRPHFVTTVHGLNSPSRYSGIMARGERVICVSDTVRRYVRTHYPQTDPDALRVIPRGIDRAMFPQAPRPDPAARARAATDFAELGGDGPLLLLPGRGTRLKGHADALALLAALRAGGIDARLWMPGALDPSRAPYVAELNALAAGLGLGDCVAITAPTFTIADAYAASDVVVQLSRQPESFGRTVVEALAVGRPVVGWAHGGVGDLLRELWPSGAVPPFDQDALLSATRAAIASPVGALDTLATMPGLLARYSLLAMQQATLDVYEELA